MYMYHKFDAILFLQTLDIYKINMKLNLHHTYDHISVENKKSAAQTYLQKQRKSVSTPML